VDDGKLSRQYICLDEGDHLISHMIKEVMKVKQLHKKPTSEVFAKVKEYIEERYCIPNLADRLLLLYMDMSLVQFQQDHQNRWKQHGEVYDAKLQLLHTQLTDRPTDKQIGEFVEANYASKS
jgi:hypothetical protein